MSKKYPNLKCPSCGKRGKYETDPNLEVYCTHCGLIIESPYPYQAGIRFDTLDYILLKQKETRKFNRLNKKRWRKWRKHNDRIKKLQKI